MTATATSDPFGEDAVTGLSATLRRVTAGYGNLMRLAHKARIPTQTLHRYCTGEREPRLSELKRLSDADGTIRAEIVRLLLEKSPELRAELLRAIGGRQ